MVLGNEWFSQLGIYTTNLKEQFMEFNWQEQHYKLHAAQNSTLEKSDLQPMKRGQETQRNIHEGKQAKYVTKEHQGFTFNKLVKRLQSMMHTLQMNLSNTQIRDQVKPITTR